MKRGEIYRTGDRGAERGDKPGCYLVLSRQFVLDTDDVPAVICAPVYGEVLGLSTEVEVGEDEGLTRASAVRCDFLILMFKRKLTTLAGRLSPARIPELDRALAAALDLRLSR